MGVARKVPASTMAIVGCIVPRTSRKPAVVMSATAFFTMMEIVAWRQGESCRNASAGDDVAQAVVGHDMQQELLADCAGRDSQQQTN
jgi:hypothetical protein